MTTKHTKPPLDHLKWETVAHEDKGDLLIVVHSHPKRIATCYDDAYEHDEVYPNKVQAIANAKLIAASPELLDACWEAYVFLFDNRIKGSNEIITRLIDVVKKATE